MIDLSERRPLDALLCWMSLASFALLVGVELALSLPEFPARVQGGGSLDILSDGRAWMLSPALLAWLLRPLTRGGAYAALFRVQMRALLAYAGAVALVILVSMTLETPNLPLAVIHLAGCVAALAILARALPLLRRPEGAVAGP